MKHQDTGKNHQQTGDSNFVRRAMACQIKPAGLVAELKISSTTASARIQTVYKPVVEVRGCMGGNIPTF